MTNVTWYVVPINDLDNSKKSSVSVTVAVGNQSRLQESHADRPNVEMNQSNI
jgi:hypothetical protein